MNNPNIFNSELEQTIRAIEKYSNVFSTLENNYFRSMDAIETALQRVEGSIGYPQQLNPIDNVYQQFDIIHQYPTFNPQASMHALTEAYPYATPYPSIVAGIENGFAQHPFELLNNSKEWNTIFNPLQSTLEHLSVFNVDRQAMGIESILSSFIEPLSSLAKLRHNFVNIYPEYDIDDNDVDDTETVDEKIISSLINPSTGEQFKESDNTLKITLLPVKKDVIEYFIKNPQMLYLISPREFEKLMAEIYHQLGYDVELTNQTRDGGKDIILTEHRITGDFVYYAECKHHKKSDYKVGIGVIRSICGTINTDRVNGGIVATNSFFTKDARDFILNNNYKFLLQLHDGKKIAEFMKSIKR